MATCEDQNCDDVKHKGSVIASIEEGCMYSLDQSDSYLKRKEYSRLKKEQILDEALHSTCQNTCNEFNEKTENNSIRKCQNLVNFKFKNEKQYPCETKTNCSCLNVFSNSSQTSCYGGKCEVKYHADFKSECREVLTSTCEHNFITRVKNESHQDEIKNVKDSFGNSASSEYYQCEKNLKSEKQEINSAPSGITTASSPPVSRAKLRNTKRRAGILYKQMTSSKQSKLTSKYFSSAHLGKSRWIPPRSPYALVQEDLFDNPWQLLVATVFLTKTKAKKALPHLHKFLAQYPRPEDVLKANYEDIDEYFKPLGLTTTRSHVIMRFTVEFLEKDWKYPRELYGIGKYGDDSYRMFCVNEWRQVQPDDIPLSMYRNWLLENAKRLGLD